ncbi:hypothetical protein [Winogradskyella wichelsiae]|uniref:hypothetical protein n=1 Tax=Winogradskyella wichelsiae TaxID=2697007 RepID=UPI0015CB1431|nr:hypothetical protein [Winogradskyella wichelsiae]
MNKVILSAVLILFFVSCSNDDEYEANEVVEIIQNDFKVEKFTGNTVAYIVENQINVSVPNEMLINSFNKYSAMTQLNKVATSVDLMEVENKFYLKFNNTDKSASKVALIEKKSNKNFKISQNSLSFMRLGGTVCTSEGCAHCCGCLPNGDYCTKCDRWQQNDCKRTTSSGLIDHIGQ